MKYFLWCQEAERLIRRRGRVPMDIDTWTLEEQRKVLQSIEAALVKDLALVRDLLADPHARLPKRNGVAAEQRAAP